ncbi:MAG: rod shape-determining protein MreC [Anaerolineae bacterium]|nr:rod shape-determining protein MreC [Anaerolineae bacterium]
MKRLPSGSLSLLVLIALAIVGIVLNETGQLEALKGVALHLTTPLQSRLATLTSSLSDLTQAARDLSELRQRNEELEADNARLIIENVRLQEDRKENERLRALLNFVQTNPDYDYRGAEVRARVIGRDPTNFQSYLIIDVGSEHGIARRMPVVTERGLVGRISEVGPNWSKVLLIIDPSSSVSALIQTTRATGTVRGQVGNELLMDLIPQKDAVHKGDIVLTSGMGGNFPKGLIIGQVTEVYQRDIEMFQQALVRPTVDFEHLEIVLVITNFQPLPLETPEAVETPES